jgi:hypothetical protein
LGSETLHMTSEKLGEILKVTLDERERFINVIQLKINPPLGHTILICRIAHSTLVIDCMVSCLCVACLHHNVHGGRTIDKLSEVARYMSQSD